MEKQNTSTRLREIMAKRGLRQVDILKLCEPYCRLYNVSIGKNDLSQYVNGKNSPGQFKLTILAKALNVSELWLMGFDEEEAAPPEDERIQRIIEKLKTMSPEALDLVERLMRMTPDQIKALDRMLQLL